MSLNEIVAIRAQSSPDPACSKVASKPRAAALHVHQKCTLLSTVILRGLFVISARRAVPCEARRLVPNLNLRPAPGPLCDLRRRAITRETRRDDLHLGEGEQR